MMSVYVFHAPVSEIQQRVSAKEFDQYKVFFRKEPLFDPWQHTGTICSMWSKARPSEFKPKLRKKASQKHIESVFRMSAAAAKKRKR